MTRCNIQRSRSGPFGHILGAPSEEGGLDTAFRSMMGYPPGGFHGAEV